MRGHDAAVPDRSPVSVARTSSRKRSIVKALTYRAVIVCLDFLAVYLFTGKVDVALGFMIVSNLYTTVGYFVHERIWARIVWGTGATVTQRTRLPAADGRVDDVDGGARLTLTARDPANAPALRAHLRTLLNHIDTERRDSR